MDVDTTNPTQAQVIDETPSADQAQQQQQSGGADGVNGVDAAEAAQKSRKENRVYVGNLSYDVKSSHLKDFMAAGTCRVAG